jgi:hypothetical protein
MVVSPGVHGRGPPPQRRRRGRFRQGRGSGHERRAALRRHHRPDQPRGALLPHLPQAGGGAGRHRHQQPLHVDRRRQVLRCGAGQQARGGPPEDTGATQQGLHPGHRARREPQEPGLPARLGGDHRAHRTPLHPQGRPRRRMERGLRLPHARRADPPLRQLRAVDHGGPGVHPLGSVRPLPVRRPGGDPADEVRPAGAALSGGARPSLLGGRVAGGPGRAHAGPGAGVRHELDRVRHPGRHSLCHRLHEPGARYGRELAHPALLRVGGGPDGRSGHQARARAAAPGQGDAVARPVRR